MIHLCLGGEFLEHDYDLCWYWVYNSLWYVQRKLVDLWLDFTHKVFDGCYLCGDGCDCPCEISIFRYYVVHVDSFHPSCLYKGLNLHSSFSVVYLICFVDRCICRSTYLNCCLFDVAVFTMWFGEVCLEYWPYMVSHGLSVPLDAGLSVLACLENE